MTKRTEMGRLDERTGMMEIGRTGRGKVVSEGGGVNNQSSILKILFY